MMPRRITELAMKLLFWIALGAALVFLLVPAALVLLLSFSNDSAIDFPPHSWGMRQYSSLMAAADWGKAVVLSVKIGVVAGLLSLAVAVPAVFGLARAVLPGRRALEFLGIAPLLIPQTAYAVGMYLAVAHLGMLGTTTGLVLANLAICFPLVFVIVSSHIARIPKELELVAMTLGAARWRAWTGITLRLLLPAVLSGFLFAFLASFDEAVFVNFLSGPNLVTLPKMIFDSVRLGVDPVITAIAALLMIGTALVMGLGYLARGAARSWFSKAGQ